MYREKLSIIKIGGDIIEDERTLSLFLNLFSNIEGKKILVHGGGKLATDISLKLGNEPRIINGRRITDSKTLEVITMVYGGLINKNIVAKLQAIDINAIGLSGADINSIKSDKRPVKENDFGFVGDVKEVNNIAIDKLLKIDFTPVFCSITHDGKGQLLNTNADTITSQIAIAMSKVYETSIYCLLKFNGVLKDKNDKESVIKLIDTKIYKKLLEENVITDGMLPKLENYFEALEKGVNRVYIGNKSVLSRENESFTTIIL